MSGLAAMTVARSCRLLGGELAARHLNGPRRRSLLEHLSGFSCGYLFGDAAGEEFADDGVQATWLHARPRSRWRLDHTFRTAAWSSAVTSRGVAERMAAIATDRASFGSFLFVAPVDSSRTRAPSLG
jgi:hypothetical protein